MDVNNTGFKILDTYFWSLRILVNNGCRDLYMFEHQSMKEGQCPYSEVPVVLIVSKSSSSHTCLSLDQGGRLCLTISLTFWKQQSDIHTHFMPWLVSCEGEKGARNYFGHVTRWQRVPSSTYLNNIKSSFSPLELFFLSSSLAICDIYKHLFVYDHNTLSESQLVQSCWMELRSSVQDNQTNSSQVCLCDSKQSVATESKLWKSSLRLKVHTVNKAPPSAAEAFSFHKA